MHVAARTRLDPGLPRIRGGDEPEQLTLLRTDACLDGPKERDELVLGPLFGFQACEHMFESIEGL